MFAVCDANRILPTFFEATTMLAFKHFKHEKVALLDLPWSVF